MLTAKVTLQIFLGLPRVLAFYRFKYIALAHVVYLPEGMEAVFQQPHRLHFYYTFSAIDGTFPVRISRL